MIQKKQIKKTDGLVLNKYIAQAGLCSRRKAIDLIKAGRVTINNRVVKEPGYRVLPSDRVAVEGQILARERSNVYILLNKPKDYVTTLSDERGRKTVIDLLKPEVTERVYPVGRLDRNTTGVLLLTNDGDLANQLAHPKYQVQKIYKVTVDFVVKPSDIQKLKQGIQLEDGQVVVDEAQYVPRERKNNVYVALHSGKYRVVRRLFEALGYEVDKLDRVQFAGLTKKGLRVGEWRYLTPEEVRELKGK
ncbi:MAG TPA: pseudouridine synthase [Candidatus Dependentiae bacterium]|nr:pseudouridine synthase [Candidatus Dependentiae bacterium]HRQ62234.1 pseudouridine synthase [Candidatus Dependentiae bacterium]